MVLYISISETYFSNVHFVYFLDFVYKHIIIIDKLHFNFVTFFNFILLLLISCPWILNFLPSDSLSQTFYSSAYSIEAFSYRDESLIYFLEFVEQEVLFSNKQPLFEAFPF